MVKTALGLALVALVAISILASACAPAAPAATATTAPAATKATENAKPTAETSQPSAPATASVAKPAATASAAAKPATSGDWKAEWDKTVAAAKKEGKVVVAGGMAEGYRTHAYAFQAAYPEITVEYTGMTASTWASKVMAERQGGQFLWDISVSGPTTYLKTFKPAGVLAPIDSALILPEILDDSEWSGGFDGGWMDKEHKYVYGFDGQVAYLAHVNRDVVKESELSSIDQLLDPQWKGKIISFDPRLNGGISTSGAALLSVKGEDWLRKFYSQDLVIAGEARQQAEMVIRGRYPIGTRLSPGEVATFREQGLGLNVKPLDPTGVASGVQGTGYGSTIMFDKAPHPNAAKLFINWLFSKDGQSAYVKTSGSNSRRLDLESNGPAETAPNPGTKYLSIGKEENIDFIERGQNIAKEIIK